MVTLRFAAIWLGLLVTASVPSTRAETLGEVVADVLDVFDEPDETAYCSGSLRRGIRVAIVPGGKGGWLAIEPPDDAFDWVAEDAIRDAGGGRIEAGLEGAPIRSGSPGARMPGPPRPPLPEGSSLDLRDLPPLTLSQGRSTRVWRAIRPPPGEVRYVRAEGIRLGPQTSLPERRVNLDPPSDDPPTEVVATAPAGDDDSIAEAARRFDAALARSRQRDQEVAQIRTRLTKARIAVDRGYDAKGYLQASSRRVDGQKVHALIGPEGVPVAYLDIPPGIATAPLLTHKVGVRGSVRFVESLGTRLIHVRDLDSLDDLR